VVNPVYSGEGDFAVTINLPEGHGITDAKVFIGGILP
jgi:hypothetical protein